ncbi:unnamed protein product [Clonostachys byssicola]|uniref:Zn(2)-C6 fungal-type domain-containing protein n=1 Tax=Clonostachys byssicola TaxID=160290 RepID=A0A9N9UA26_9HYPO|nr:unnamed protein product [Clonostachys byssicola]
MPNGPRSRNGCAACKSQRLKCNENWPSCGRCTRLSLPCSGPIVRVRWSHKHQTSHRDNNESRQKTMQVNQTAQPTRTGPSDLPDRPEGTASNESFSSLRSIHVPSVTDASVISLQDSFPPPRNGHDSDAWIEETFCDTMHEFIPFGLGPNTAAIPIQTPTLLHADDTFDAALETAEPNSRDLLHGERGDLASPAASLQTSEAPGMTRPAVISSQALQALEIPQPYTLSQIDPPFNDHGTLLVEYYFRDTAAILALFDSEMNPFRSIVSRLWASSELIYYTMQSMAASFLSNIYPQLLGTGSFFRGKAISLLKGLNDSAIDEETLVAIFMIGGTASWFNVNDIGFEYFRLLKMHVQKMTASDRLSSRGESQSFFQNTLAGWEMFLAFVVDDDDDLFHGDASGGLESSSLFPMVQIPHPVTGVAHEIHTHLARVGRLVRKNRRRAISKHFYTHDSVLAVMRELDEAAELEKTLTSLQVPLESTIVQTGDTQTPNWHLTTLADLYRLVGLIQLYQVFPDTLESGMKYQNFPFEENDTWAKISALEAEERLRQLTLAAVDTLRSIPAESGTKDFHPFLVVAVCSGLTLPMVGASTSTTATAGLDNFLPLTAAPVHRARGFLRSRLQLLMHSLPKIPVQRCIDIVEATWAESDNRHANSQSRPAYWMDVMMQNNWETFMA